MTKILAAILVLTAASVAQMPVAELPRVYIDTTYSSPAVGQTWKAHTSTEFKNALTSASPGDTIVLDAGAAYQGNFTLPAKTNPNNQWIYIISSALSNLPPSGTRVSPSDAANMPKIVTPGVSAAITLPPGANHYRLVGLEVYTASTQGCNPKANPPANCYSYFLINANSSPGKPLVDSITVDRCYIHGSPTQDVQHAVTLNASNAALVDSYISDIHLYQTDSQATGAYYSPGPIKIVNNFLEATTENVLFGGAGGLNNPWVPSDIEIRNNYLFKRMSWAQVGITIPPNLQWSVKNHLEFKSARRVLVDGNVMENNWCSAQTGFSVLFTVRTNSSGLLAVVDDITFSNNILKNVASGIITQEWDYACLASQGCTNVGESKRIKIYNNLILLGNENIPGASPNYAGITVMYDLVDHVIQHNTIVLPPNAPGWPASIFFNSHGFNIAKSSTHNIWILDNVLFRQPTGSGQHQGTEGLTGYMGDPSPLAPRYTGNIMFVPSRDQPQAFPQGNVSTSTIFAYKDPVKYDFELLSHTKARTTDGAPAGVDMSKIEAAITPVTVPPARVRPEVVVLRPTEKAEFHSSTRSSSWHLTPKIGSITSTGLYTAPASVKESEGVTLCNSDSESGDACASIVLIPNR